MKKFSFELQEVLEFRNFEQKQAEAELGKALAVENEINSNLNTLALQYAATKEKLKGSLNFDNIYTANQHIKLLDFQKEELLKQLTQAKIITEQKREILRECMKKTTALEKLKEQKLEEYKESVRKEEAAFIDELGTQGYFKHSEALK